MSRADGLRSTRVREAVTGFLFLGLSWQHLSWRDVGERRDSRQKAIVRVATMCHVHHEREPPKRR
jgi:hypothetical protein